MKRLLLILFTVLAALPMLAIDFTYEYEGQTLKYSIISSSDLTCKVAQNTGITGDLKIPTSVNYDGKTYSVTSIGYDAFKGCSDLTSVEIPNSVTSIGDYAFAECSSLKEITIADGDKTIDFGSSVFSDVKMTKVYLGRNFTYSGSYNSYAPFYGKSSLADLTIGNSVTSIGNYAFFGCSVLTSLEIPNSVTSIGGSAFSGCSSLKEITIVDGGKSIEFGTNVFTDVKMTKLYLGRNFTYSGYHNSDAPFYGKSTLTDLTIGNSVTSIDNSAFYDCSGLTSVEIPNSVTSIDNSAFYGCSGLTSVKIPNSVTSIGNYAFFGCSALTSLEIPNSVTSIGASAFYGCNRLTSVEIPNSVTSIGASTFYGCSGLTSVEIPNSVTSIGNSAFSGCSGLKEITIADGDKTIEFGTSVFSDVKMSKLYLGRNFTYSGYYSSAAPFYGKSSLTELTIGNSVTSIGASAFSGCSGLTSLEIPNSVTSIGASAFYRCSGLTSVDIPNSVTSIGNSAFSGCSGLKEITLVDGETNLEFGEKVFDNVIPTKLYLGRNFTYSSYYSSYAPFYGKSSLTKLTIGNSVTSIGDDAFYGCNSLKEITIADGDKTIEFGTSVFSDVKMSKLYLGRNFTYSGYYSYAPFYGKSSLTELTIGNSVTSIGNSAFSGCSGLTSLEIPNSVTSIGNSAFYDCSGLTSLEIPNSVTSISIHAFADCSALTSLEIPNSVTDIGSSAFYGCSGLTSVVIPNSVIAIGNQAFSDCSELKEITIADGKRNLEFGEKVFSNVKPTKLYLGRNFTYSGSSSSYAPFYSKSSLTELTIANSVTSIGNGAFYGCSGLKEITIADGETNLKFGENVFSNVNPTKLYLGRNFTYSGSQPPFQGKLSLTELTIGNSVTSIGNYAFYGCSRLTSVEIPNSVTSIGNYAFYDCKGLKELIIGKSVTSIGENAFVDSQIEKIISLSFLAPSISGESFSNYTMSLADVTIPEGSLTSYQEKWGLFRYFANVQ